MTDPTLCFIGAGKMAQALISGLLRRGHDPARLRASDPESAAREQVGAMGIDAFSDNALAIAGADLVVLAVKPQSMDRVAREMRRPMGQHRPLLVSIAAGITTEALGRWFGEDLGIVRAMPNTPALVGAGISGLFANPSCDAQAREQAEYVLRCGGEVIWFEDEEALDAVTAVSGSGPAYFFTLMESMIDAAVAMGMTSEHATQLTLHTAAGAARMALESPDSPAQLRSNVTSKGGTTAAALDVFDRAGFGAVVSEALFAARDRSRELSEEAGH